MVSELLARLSELAEGCPRPAEFFSLVASYLRLGFAVGSKSDAAFRTQMQKLIADIRALMGWEDTKDPALVAFRDIVAEMLEVDIAGEGLLLSALEALARPSEPSERPLITEAC